MDKQFAYCCEDFAKQAMKLGGMAGGGLMYPAGMQPNSQFEPQGDGTWAINGCCGGGCYVVNDMRFCPYCGAKLADPLQEDGDG